MRFSFRRTLRSFGHAGHGFLLFLRSEQNAWLHLVALCFAVIAGIILQLEAWEWVAVVMAAGLVFAAEMFNTSMERLCDHVTPGRHQAIKSVKDLAAGAVVFAALTAFVVGCIVFGPKLAAWL
jgi:diacylglycerol kinase